ncbi:hypothetical protein EU98_1811 [Prochlorococcus marinus str. MIT 9314]|uniref:Uncharacterized protein n=1 Tax=Prochlorococcus marinus str. MIT 9314 TaxID=167548 RepID=A0A0A2AIL9_PROMR|nr:hypothetical protein EU98_1811 [Prochlorococcus marinus str. MIT 9314]
MVSVIIKRHAKTDLGKSTLISSKASATFSWSVNKMRGEIF